jgi:hypothetical protein
MAAGRFGRDQALFTDPVHEVGEPLTENELAGLRESSGLSFVASRRIRRPSARPQAGDRCVGVLALLLPAAVRGRYVEEWHAELFDQRAAFVSRRSRLAYVARLAIRCPMTAVSMWSRARQAVE